MRRQRLVFIGCFTVTSFGTIYIYFTQTSHLQSDNNGCMKQQSGLTEIRRNVQQLLPFYVLTAPYNTDALHIEIDRNGGLRTKLYDKRDDLEFPIVTFPFMYSNIPAAPAYGV